MPSDKDLILIFSINEYKLAIDVKDLVEVAENLDMAKKVQAQGVVGILDFRGKRVPVLDFKYRLGCKDKNREYNAALVIRRGELIVVLPVDHVEQVTEIKKRSMNFPKIMLKVKDAFDEVYEFNGDLVIKINTEALFDKMFIEETYTLINEEK